MINEKCCRLNFQCFSSSCVFLSFLCVDFGDGNLLKLFDLHIFVRKEIIREFSIICMRNKDEGKEIGKFGLNFDASLKSLSYFLTPCHYFSNRARLNVQRKSTAQISSATEGKVKNERNGISNNKITNGIIAFHYNFISGHIFVINNLIYVPSFPGDKKVTNLIN